MSFTNERIRQPGVPADHAQKGGGEFISTREPKESPRDSRSMTTSDHVSVDPWAISATAPRAKRKS